MHALVHPWTFGFMQRAALELLLVGVAAGVLGCWIVLYELSYSAESLAHALFPGLVLAALLGFPLVLGGAAGVLAAAAAIAVAARVPGIERDTAVAVVITSLFGLGVLLALAPSSPPGVESLLFGDLLGVSWSDLATAAVLAAAVLAGLGLLHRQLLAVGFDRRTARALGGRPLLTDLSLLALVAAATLIAVRGLGNLLVVAVLVGPAATARAADSPDRDDDGARRRRRSRLRRGRPLPLVLRRHGRRRLGRRTARARVPVGQACTKPAVGQAVTKSAARAFERQTLAILHPVARGHRLPGHSGRARRNRPALRAFVALQ